MLEEIDHINWKDLGAGKLDVSRRLRDLASDDHDVVDKACGELAYFVIDTDKSDLKLAVIKFLIGLLADPKVIYKDLISELLVLEELKPAPHRAPVKAYIDLICPNYQIFIDLLDTATSFSDGEALAGDMIFLLSACRSINGRSVAAAFLSQLGKSHSTAILRNLLERLGDIFVQPTTEQELSAMRKQYIQIARMLEYEASSNEVKEEAKYQLSRINT